MHVKLQILETRHIRNHLVAPLFFTDEQGEVERAGLVLYKGMSFGLKQNQA